MMYFQRPENSLKPIVPLRSVSWRARVAPVRGPDGGGGAGTMFDVTHSWMLRLQHVVVPMAAQQMSGRTSWLRIVSVRCVAGQHMAARGWG